MCIDHDPYQTQAPEGRKVYMGTCCQTPVTPNQRQMRVWHLSGFKRLLDTVFYIPVAPLGLKSCGCFRCYKHIVPTGLKRVSRTRKTTKLTLMVRFLTAPFCINISNNAKDENISVRSRAIHAPLFFECKRRYELRDYKRVFS